jgi:hypothetical protein
MVGPRGPCSTLSAPALNRPHPRTANTIIIATTTKTRTTTASFAVRRSSSVTFLSSRRPHPPKRRVAAAASSSTWRTISSPRSSRRGRRVLRLLVRRRRGCGWSEWRRSPYPICICCRLYATSAAGLTKGGMSCKDQNKDDGHNVMSTFLNRKRGRYIL